MITGEGDGVAWAYNDEEDPSEEEQLAWIEDAVRAFAEHGARDLSSLLGLGVRQAVAEVERMALTAEVHDEWNQTCRADFSAGRIRLFTVQNRVHRATAG